MKTIENRRKICVCDVMWSHDNHGKFSYITNMNVKKKTLKRF